MQIIFIINNIAIDMILIIIIMSIAMLLIGVVSLILNDQLASKISLTKFDHATRSLRSFYTVG